MNLSQVTQPRSSRFLVWNKNNSFLTHIPPSHNAVSKKCHPLTTAFDRLLSFSPGSLALPSGPSRWSMWVARGAVSVVSASSSSHSLVQDKPVCPVKLAFLVEGSHFRVVKKKKIHFTYLWRQFICEVQLAGWSRQALRHTWLHFFRSSVLDKLTFCLWKRLLTMT